MLIASRKERYQVFCDREEWIPIFSQPWWMDCTCGAMNWDVYLVGDGSDIQAAMPYYLYEDSDCKSIKRAILTQNNGILIKYPQNITLISKQKYDEKIINNVCDYIESLGVSKYEQQFHYRFDFWLPFFWRYYKGVVKYTYVIENCADYDSVYSGYSSKVKNALRKAMKEVDIEETQDLTEFYSINRLSFLRQGIMIPYSFELFERLYNACKERNCCKLLKATGKDGIAHAVAMLVWDRSSVYFLLNGANPEIRSSQANVALIDTSIKIAGHLKLSFDFEGSVIKNVNHAFREYGGFPKPYFNISKDFIQR